MQGYADQIREQVWAKLHEIFHQGTGGQEVITPAQLEQLVRGPLKEDDDREVEYVLKNLFRLDTDGSGQIDFEEFANFLLKRHCGEISLQREHKAGRISNGKDRKITAKEFAVLLNNAYSFLGVKVDEAHTNELFNDVDTDKDGLITYVEYFRFIDRTLLKGKAQAAAETKVVAPAPTEDQKLLKSRLRSFLWAELRKIFSHYDTNKNGNLEIDEIEVLLNELLETNSRSDIDFILYNVFKLQPNAGVSYINFDTFASFFLLHVAELGLSKFSKANPNNNKTLTRDQFVVLFRSSFHFLSISYVKDEILWKFFAKIDKNNDGLISFAEYLDWITRFLVPLLVYGTEWYIPEDDEDLPLGADLFGTPGQYSKPIVAPAPVTAPVPTTSTASTTTSTAGTSSITKPANPFHFSNLLLAKQIRQQLLGILIPFDKNKNKRFEKGEIVDALVTLMNADEHHVFYVVANVFRYDRDNDGNVTYDELADFFLEMHCGEMAIQRLHRVGTYSRGADRVMNLQEFINTLNHALAFIKCTASVEDLTQLFKEVDTDSDGWITYKQYFEFLRFYFGSLSVAAAETRKENEEDPNAKLSPADDFSKIVVGGTTGVFSLHGIDSFDRDSLIRFLKEVFHLTDAEIDFILKNFFRYDVSKNGLILQADMVRIFLELFFGELMLLKFHREKRFAKWQERLLNESDFILLVSTCCSFLGEQAPNNALLSAVFKFIDTDNDGWITYKDYIMFIRKYLGGRSGIFAGDDDIFKNFQDKDNSNKDKDNTNNDKDKKRGPGTEDEHNLSDSIWGELRIIYNSYVKGKYLTEGELEILVKEILKETSKRELDYIFWNMFRFDPNHDKQIEFEEFAPFILKHTAELSLQRFHVLQTLGKDRLNFEEFRIVMEGAYSFLKSISKETEVLRRIFKTLDTDNDSFVTYREFMVWVHLTISTRVR